MNALRMGPCLLFLALGCGDDGLTGTGGQGGDVGGGGGEGGAPPGCPPGSHDDGAGACVAELGDFAEGPSLADERDHHMTWAAKRPGGTFLYAAGGWADMTSPVQTIERAPLAEDGGIGAWQTLPTSTNVSGAAVVSTDDVVVFAGGYRSSGPSTAVDVITIGEDGALSDPADGPFLEDSRFHGAGVLVDGRVYVVGGLDYTGSSLATVERATLNGGSLGSWAFDTALPIEISHHGLATDGEALYVTGGLKRVDNDFQNDEAFDAVLRARIAEDGSLEPWESVGTLPVPLAVHASFVHAGQLYVIGGLDMADTKFVKTIRRAPLAGDGLGAWEELPVQLPRARGHTHQTPIVDGVLYSIGGHLNGGSQTQSYFARFE